MTIQNDETVWVRCDTLLTPWRALQDRVLRIENGVIGEILPLDARHRVPAKRLIHEPGAIVAPGFVDLHIHGARGRDLMDGTRESVGTVAETLARHGTTSFLATTLSAPDSDTEAALRGLSAQGEGAGEGARLIGIHMEGPFLNPVRRGTHSASWLRLANVQAFLRFLELAGGSIRKLTLAPEMDPGMSLVREAAARGIQVSLGHSDATLDEARAAVEAGASQATHTFNAMRPMHQREPGILGLVLNDPRVFAEIIADGIHVHPHAVRILWNMKGAERTVLVTDGVSAVDMPDGRYPLGDRILTVERGECRDAEGTLAGSTLTLDRAVANLVSWLNIPAMQAVAAASATPARSLGLGARLGTVAAGAAADLVFLGPGFGVLKTMVAGRIVYQGAGQPEDPPTRILPASRGGSDPNR